MPEPTETPIVVSESALPGIVATALRYGLTLLGGLLISKNILPADTDVNQIVGVLLVLATAIYGVIKTKKTHDQRVTMASALPDSIAQVK